MSDVDYDVLVIGAGPGGYVAAIRAAQLGLKTACIEKRETLGGTCLNVGCMPSKALLHASELYAHAAEGVLARFGVKVEKVGLDWGAMQAEKDSSVKELTGGIAFLFKKNKVDWIKGQAQFLDATSVQVGDRTIRAKNFVIATGSEVATLPGISIDGKQIISSTEALSLPKVPGSMVVIGGGVIGLELGSVYRRLGTKVTVVEYLDRVLPTMDGELSKAFAQVLKKQGFELKLSSKVTGVKTGKTGATVSVEPAQGGAVEDMKADVVLVSVGRRPNTDGLGLDKAGITLDAKGRIPTQPDMSTTVPGIWAIGDVIEGPMLAHKAEDEGIAVAENIAGLTGLINHDVIPNVVYTAPEVASVGKSEEELKAAGIAYKVGKFPFAANSRAKANRETEGFVKVLADASSDRVLGVHILGTLAGTMIAQAAQAMEFGASSEDIAYTCHAHPTHAEALKEAAMAVTGKAIHI